MKLFSTTVSLVVLLIVLACSVGESQNKKSTIFLDFNTFKVNKPIPTYFLEFGKMTKAIKLETTDDSVFGNIDRVRIDKKTGDILIGDYDSRKKVLRFSKNGKFITSYGNIGQAPAEYQSLLGFSTTDYGDIILLTDSKLIKLSPSGHLLQEVRINFNARDIETIQDKIFVSVLLYRNHPKEKNAIQIFNSFLINTGGIGQYDTRYEKYIFTGYKTLAASNNRLYFTDDYDFGVSVYDLNSQTISRLRIPSNNSSLNKIWEKRHFVESDRNEIKNQLQFFSAIYNYSDDLFLFESYKEKNSINVWRLNLDKKEATILSLFCFYKNSKIKNHDQLFTTGIIGSDDKGLIVAFHDPEEFDRYKKSNPVLKDLTFALDDNPIIAFFEFKNGK